MSKREHTALPVIEWSPNHVRVFHPVTGAWAEGPSLESVKSALAGSSKVIVALSRRSSFIRTTRLPDAPKADVARILSLQIGQLFPVNPSDVAVDFFQTNDRNAEGRLAVVGAVTSETLRALHEALSEAGLDTDSIVPAALGSAIIARQAGRTECAIVEQVPEGLAIDVIAEGELRATRVVPLLAPAAIGQEVSRSFAVAKVAETDAIGAGGFTYPEADGTLSTSGLQALSGEAIPLHLELPEIIARRSHELVERRKRLALLLWVATLGVCAVVYDIRSSDADVVAGGDAKWRKHLNTLKSVKSQAELKANSLTKAKIALDLGFAPKQQLSDVATLATNLAPEGVWLTGLTAERGKPLLLRGTATNGDGVTKYLEQLSGQPRFRDVKLVFANNGLIEKVDIVQFSMSSHIVGNFPLATEDSKK